MISFAYDSLVDFILGGKEVIKALLRANAAARCVLLKKAFFEISQNSKENTSGLQRY